MGTAGKATGPVPGGKGKGPNAPGGKGKGSQGPGTPKGSGKPAVSDWRAQAAQRRALAEAEAKRREPWTKLKVTSLPAGPLEAPRWDTAFAATIPDEGTTHSVIFLATRAGAYCLKTSGSAMHEYLATLCMRRCGVPAPAVRLVCAVDAERKEIVAALRRVAGLEERRGFLEKATRIRGLCAKAFARPELFVMELAAGATCLGSREFDAARARQWLDVSGEDEAADALAVQRLQGLGRMWLVDVIMGFRDRVSWHPLIADARRGHWALRDRGQVAESRLDDEAHRREEAWRACIDNGDNVLLTPSHPGLYAIDNHWKLQPACATEMAEMTEALEAARLAARTSAASFFPSLCAEQARNQEGSDAADFLRKFVRGQTGGREGDAEIIQLDGAQRMDKYRSTGDAGGAMVMAALPPHLLGGKDIGYVMSDAAMRHVRLGILSCLRDMLVDSSGSVPTAVGDGDSQFVAWLREQVRQLENLNLYGTGSPHNTHWAEEARQLNVESLRAQLEVWHGAVAEHAEMLSGLPPQPIPAPGGPVLADASLDLEASELEMCPRLWSAIPESTRALLRAELLPDAGEK